MDSSPSSSGSTTVHHVFSSCQKVYQKLAFCLLQSGSPSPSPFDRNVNEGRLLDEFGRLKIWGEQTKASLSPSARGSLDDFLRNEDRLREEVKGILLQLEALLNYALPMAQKTRQGGEDSVEDSDLLVSDSDYSSQSELGDEGQDNLPSRPRVSRLTVTLSHIFEHIQLLYHLASLLRRPGLKGRYLRRISWEKSAETFDLRHVEEKLRCWEREAIEDVGRLQDDPVVTPHDIQERLTSHADADPHSILAKRFAKANLQRREQMKYWSRHQDNKPAQKQPLETELATPKQTGVSKVTAPEDDDVVGAEDDKASTLKQASSRQVTDTTKQTAHTFSTATGSALSHGGQDTPRPRTVYAESLVAGKRPARIPPHPDPKLPGRFECPYCHMPLDRGSIDKDTWTHHVFRDLRPYSCTFVECPNPDKLYSTRHDWIYHEMQIHRRQWVCHECSHQKPFLDKEVFVQHLNRIHSGSWSQHQLGVILDMSERPIEESESEILDCPLCRSTLPLGKLLIHIAGHLEEISLFSLPMIVGEAEEEENAIADSRNGAPTISLEGDGTVTDDQTPLSFSDIPVSARGAEEEPMEDFTTSPLPIPLSMEQGSHQGPGSAAFSAGDTSSMKKRHSRDSSEHSESLWDTSGMQYGIENTPNNDSQVPNKLTDPKRAKNMESRGEDDYRRHYHQMHTDRKPITTGVHHTDAILLVFNELRGASVPFAPNRESINFVPRAKFDEIMTPWMVLQIIQQLDYYRMLKPDEQKAISMDVYYGTSDARRSPSRKLLAALITTGDIHGPRPVESFNILVEEGMSDKCLPLSRDESTGELCCEFHSRIHPSINKLGSIVDQFRDDFTSWSRALTTPYIVWDEKGLQPHYIMKGGGPLPTMWTSPPGNSGGFGMVWKVDIDPRDRRFKSHHQGKKRYFGLKKLNLNNTSTLTKEFDMDVRSLIFAESRVNGISEIEDTETEQHPIQFLATFEVYNTRNGPPDYYLLFPWADGNLEDLWNQENQQRNPMDHMQLSFMIDQFYCLAKALQCVHNDSQQIAINMETDRGQFGRHGDINPKNLLIFRRALYEGTPWLGLRIVLAWFGLARLHSEESISNYVGSNGTYGAPEFEIDGGTLSPKTDVFSLGCVFLLHIVWLFDGVNEGLMRFSQQRKDEKDSIYGDHWELDNFWVNTVTEERHGAAIKESVKRRLDDLKNRDNCVEVMGEILTFIEHRMLRVSQTDRLGAGRLVFELDRIRQKWKRADSLYGSRAWKDSDMSRQYSDDGSSRSTGVKSVADDDDSTELKSVTGDDEDNSPEIKPVADDDDSTGIKSVADDIDKSSRGALN